MRQGQGICDSISQAGAVCLPGRIRSRRASPSFSSPLFRRPRCSGARLPLRREPPDPAAQPDCVARLLFARPIRGGSGRPLFAGHDPAHAGPLAQRGPQCAASAAPPPSGAGAQGEPRLAKSARRGDDARTRGLRCSPSELDRPPVGGASEAADRHRSGRAECAARAGEPRLCLSPPHLDGTPQSGGAARLLPKSEGVKALLSAGAATPPVREGFPYRCFPLPDVPQEVVDPGDAEDIAELCKLLRKGRADLYVEDEADLALLPTLTRTWMPRGEQQKVRAPGTNQKRSVAAATDVATGCALWRTDERRCAAQFGLLMQRCITRSVARRRIAILVVDNAKSHKPGKTGLIRLFLQANVGLVVLVFLPPYSPHLQPAERVWRQWRPSVTHNHSR